MKKVLNLTLVSDAGVFWGRDQASLSCHQVYPVTVSYNHTPMVAIHSYVIKRIPALGDKVSVGVMPALCVTWSPMQGALCVLCTECPEMPCSLGRGILQLGHSPFPNPMEITWAQG